MNTKHKSTVVVVVHDAGGTEAIIPYLHAHQEKYLFVVYATGPAKSILTRERVTYQNIIDDENVIASLLAKHEDAKFAILGTGWMTRIELHALQYLKHMGVRTVVFLESWEKYRERFGYPKKGWKNNLPNEIWVGDDIAKKIATRQFPGIVIRKKRDNYFTTMKRRYKEIRKGTEPRQVLFLSVCVPETIHALRTLLTTIANKKERKEVIIRFHPADARDRYDDLIAHYVDRVVITKSKEKDIVRDFARARLVVGTETVAMSLAVTLGLPTVSLDKVGEKRFLPFPEIIKAKRGNARAVLGKLIK